MTSWVPIPILIPVNRGANPGYFPDPGQIGIPRFPEIPAEWDRDENPEYFPDTAQSGSGESRLFSRPNRDGAGRGFGDFGVWLRGRMQWPVEDLGPAQAL